MYLWYCKSEDDRCIDHAIVLTKTQDTETKSAVLDECRRTMRCGDIALLSVVELPQQFAVDTYGEVRRDIAFIA
jgi:hypothetical protein